MDGVININKEAGYTSSDVVTILRGILRIKKIGHTGTLDPGATGVLPMCIGKATRLVEMLMDHDKEYVADLIFGQETDTGDVSGQVTNRKDYAFSAEAFERAVRSQTGDILQVPPMYSAIKVGGVRLYDLAHEGKEIERPARPVHVESIRILHLDEHGAKIHVACSKGTYIRTLIEDIGRSSGMLATMQHLCRVRSGSFEIGEALTLSQVKELHLAGKLGPHVYPIEYFFMDLPSIRVQADQELLLKNGNPMDLPVMDADRVRVLDTMGNFKAIYRTTARPSGSARLFKPEKMF